MANVVPPWKPGEPSLRFAYPLRKSLLEWWRIGEGVITPSGYTLHEFTAPLADGNSEHIRIVYNTKLYKLVTYERATMHQDDVSRGQYLGSDADLSYYLQAK